MQHKNYSFFILLLLLSVGLYSCKSTEQTTDQSDAAATAENTTGTEETGLNLAAYRNTLGDSYTTRQHDMPSRLLQSSGNDQFGNRNPFEGFRIQLISTRSVATADSVARSFRIWSDTTFTGYKPEAHQFFKQPHYRVHVGDFSNRQRAITVSRLIKRQFPNAWVVHDRIEPNLVPADTVEIRLKSRTERNQNN